MNRNVVALVVGYAKAADLYRISFEQLRKLKNQGVIDRIVYVTWDSPRIDAVLKPLERMPDVEVKRIAEPQLQGAPLQKGVTYQIRNLEAALAYVADDETLVLKTRPDFIFANEAFLKRKILAFDTLCAPSPLPERMAVDAPAPRFKRKVWVPWANAAEPLFISDTVYLGLKCDIAKLADRAAERFLGILTDGRCDRITHISRPLNVFLPDYPMLRRYGENIRDFISMPDYRDRFAYVCGKQPFFWRLALLNAWILATQFHVDGGRVSDLIFFPNRNNFDATTPSVAKLKMDMQFSAFDVYRKNMRPGSLRVCWLYTTATLAGDEWQHALFTDERIDDFSHEDIRRLLEEAIRYDRATIGQMEDAFYRAADELYHSYITANPGVINHEGVIDHPSRCKKKSPGDGAPRDGCPPPGRGGPPR